MNILPNIIAQFNTIVNIVVNEYKKGNNLIPYIQLILTTQTTQTTTQTTKIPILTKTTTSIHPPLKNNESNSVTHQQKNLTMTDEPAQQKDATPKTQPPKKAAPAKSTPQKPKEKN
jgi:hypothetical protein